MKIGHLKELLKGVPNDAEVYICGADVQALTEIADMGWVQERGCYVLWESAGEVEGNDSR